jgi:ligand-binding sensor domain-containing protein
MTGQGSIRATNGYIPCSLLLPLLFVLSCTETGKAPIDKESAGGAISQPAAQPDSATLAARLTSTPVATEQISQYIRRMFQDRDENIWFGTTSDGVCRYDPSTSPRTGGRSLTYFTTADGLSGNWVSAMAQDARGDLWFATGGGVSRYDGTEFTSYTTKDGLASDQVWSVLLDRSGGLWFGTEGGVSRFDGKRFTPFPIPAADLSNFPYYHYPKQINWIIQDKAGNIWFASNGGGVYRYDGQTLTNFSEIDGLCNNFVQTIMEDRAGDLWFGTRYGGLCKYDGNRFTKFTKDEGLKTDHVWTLLQDQAGLIWISAISYGLCSYDGKTFTCYTERDGAALKNVQSLLEDASGQLWVGTSGGVYRLMAGKFINWTKKG